MNLPKDLLNSDSVTLMLRLKKRLNLLQKNRILYLIARGDAVADVVQIVQQVVRQVHVGDTLLRDAGQLRLVEPIDRLHDAVAKRRYQQLRPDHHCRVAGDDARLVVRLLREGEFAALRARFRDAQMACTVRPRMGRIEEKEDKKRTLAKRQPDPHRSSTLPGVLVA